MRCSDLLQLRRCPLLRISLFNFIVQPSLQPRPSSVGELERRVCVRRKRPDRAVGDRRCGGEVGWRLRELGMVMAELVEVASHMVVALGELTELTDELYVVQVLRNLAVCKVDFVPSVLG